MAHNYIGIYAKLIMNFFSDFSCSESLVHPCLSDMYTFWWVSVQASCRGMWSSGIMSLKHQSSPKGKYLRGASRSTAALQGQHVVGKDGASLSEFFDAVEICFRPEWELSRPMSVNGIFPLSIMRGCNTFKALREGLVKRDPLVAGLHQILQHWEPLGLVTHPL